MKTEFIIHRVFEDDKIIIYKRMFNLRNCSGDKRYYESSKISNVATNREFRSIAQVRAYLRGRK